VKGKRKVKGEGKREGGGEEGRGRSGVSPLVRG